MKLFKYYKKNCNLNFLKYRFIIFLCINYLIFEDYIYKKHPYLSKSIYDYDLVIPISVSSINSFISHKKFFKKFLNHSNIVLIGKKDIDTIIFNDNSIEYIPEDNLISKQKINEFLLKNRNIETIRDGWYVQQFLKMAYSRICKKEYYLIWDSDTIPIKPIKMFENDHPIFDMKIEHNLPYFNTMDRLIKGLKFSNMSYISEHMLINTELMKNLLFDIENNSKINGKLFWEKILMAIHINDINISGFSEFETYGTYVDTKFPNLYKHRNWFSLREAKTFFNNSDNLSEEDIKWMSKDYHALTFENYHIFEPENLKFVKDSKIQNLYKSYFLFQNYNNTLTDYKKFNITLNN